MVKAGIAETDQSLLLKPEEFIKPKGLLAMQNSVTDEALLLESLINRMELNSRFMRKAKSEYTQKKTKKGKK